MDTREYVLEKKYKLIKQNKRERETKITVT